MAHGHKEEIYAEFSSDRMNSLQDARLRWRRQASVAAVNEVLPSSLRVDVNNARNDAELKLIHDGAHPTAMFYITTILVMYLIGLILIFVHYMNSSYGKWNWTLSDAWDELTPSFFNQSIKAPTDMGGGNNDTKQQRRSVTQRDDVLVGEEEEVRFENNWKSNLDSSNVSSGCSGQTGISSLPSDGDENSSEKDKNKQPTSKKAGKNFLSPSSANKKHFYQKKSNKQKIEAECFSSSDYHYKSSSDATCLSALTANVEDHATKPTKSTKESNISFNVNDDKMEEIMVVADESASNNI